MIFPNPDALLLFLPAFFRVGGVLISAPLLTHVQIPRTVKAGFALFISIAIWPLLSISNPPIVAGLWSLAMLAFTELVIGLLIGLTATLVVVGLEYAGQMIGSTIGLAIVNVVDPIFDAQVSIISRVYGLFGLALFFASGAHYMLVRALVDSFIAAPVGLVAFSPAPLVQMIDLGGELFLTAVRIAAPVLAVMLLTEVAMGFVVRTVPQMNIFIVGFPLKIGLGLFLIAATLPMVARLCEHLFRFMDHQLGRLIGGI